MFKYMYIAACLVLANVSFAAEVAPQACPIDGEQCQDHKDMGKAFRNAMMAKKAEAKTIHAKPENDAVKTFKQRMNELKAGAKLSKPNK